MSWSGAHFPWYAVPVVLPATCCVASARPARTPQARLRQATLTAIRKFAADNNLKEPRSILDAGCSGGVRRLDGRCRLFKGSHNEHAHPNAWLLCLLRLSARGNTSILGQLSHAWLPASFSDSRRVQPPPAAPLTSCSGNLHALAGGRVSPC